MSAIIGIEAGEYGNAFCDAGSAASATAACLGGIAVLSGATGPAAPLVMLGGTIAYFGFRGIRWAISDGDEIKFLKEMNVYRDPSKPRAAPAACDRPGAPPALGAF